MLLEGDLSPLLSAGPAMKKHTLRALAALSKFLGIHDEFTELRKRYGIKWSHGSAARLVARRLSGEVSNGIFEWIVKALRVLDEDHRTLTRYVLFTGVRLDEACKTWKLIHELGHERVNEYYNAAFNALEHYRYPKLFFRETKNLFVSFVTPELVEDILRGRRDKITWWSVSSALRKRGLPSRYGDIRELWATWMTRYLSEPEINFLQGRVSQSTFMRHYFNPKLIADLRDRTLNAASKLLEKIT